MMTYWKIIILFVIKSALVLKNSFIASLSVINNFWKPRPKLHGDEVTDFCNKEISKVDSGHTHLTVIS